MSITMLIWTIGYYYHYHYLIELFRPQPKSWGLLSIGPISRRKLVEFSQNTTKTAVLFLKYEFLRARTFERIVIETWL